MRKISLNAGNGSGVYFVTQFTCLDCFVLHYENGPGGANSIAQANIMAHQAPIILALSI